MTASAKHAEKRATMKTGEFDLTRKEAISSAMVVNILTSGVNDKSQLSDINKLVRTSCEGSLDADSTSDNVPNVREHDGTVDDSSDQDTESSCVSCAGKATDTSSIVGRCDNPDSDVPRACLSRSMSFEVFSKPGYRSYFSRSRSMSCIVLSESRDRYGSNRSRSKSEVAWKKSLFVVQESWTQFIEIRLKGMDIDPYDERSKRKIKIKQDSSDKYMKVDHALNPPCRLVPGPLTYSGDTFTSMVRTAIDMELGHSYTLYVFSYNHDGEVYYLHTEKDKSSLDVHKLRLSLEPPESRDLFTGRSIPEKAEKFFFCGRLESKLVLESFAFRGYYISFETDEIVVRRTRTFQRSNHISLFPSS